MDDQVQHMLDKRASLIQGMIAPLAPGIAVAAFATTPLWPFVDPYDFANAGGHLAAGAAAMAIAVMLERRWMKQVAAAISLLFVIWGGIELGLMFTASKEVVRRHAAQCLALEEDMAAVRPRRANSAELFEALACSPRAAKPIQFYARGEAAR